MTHYLVIWSLDVWENTPLKAAKSALRTQRDPNSIATVFEVNTVKTGEKYLIDAL